MYCTTLDAGCFTEFRAKNWVKMEAIVWNNVLYHLGCRSICCTESIDLVRVLFHQTNAEVNMIQMNFVVV